MDPQGTAMMTDGLGGGVYNLAEIWPGFANATSFALDPMLMDQRSTHHLHTSPNSRKRREEEEDDDDDNHHDFSNNPAAGGATSTSNDNNITNNAMSESDSKRQKAALSNDISENKPQGEGNSGKAPEQSGKPAQPSKQDYIHVRARRGQATDSHSLAERARREKISERMKILQDLVPGCNKVIGKALVLDEIINYIQALQRQVEFLSLKLEAVNARGIEAYPSKDYAQQPFDAPGMPQFGSQSNREYGRGSSPEWLHMQLGGGFERSS